MTRQSRIRLCSETLIAMFVYAILMKEQLDLKKKGLILTFLQQSSSSRMRLAETYALISICFAKAFINRSIGGVWFQTADSQQIQKK